ncbi:MAG: zinc-binding dehydrogenase [Parvibaculaceae bacterium]|nr:zinc-binding dehydrogenase [Parvibaculaceae bacterium]
MRAAVIQGSQIRIDTLPDPVPMEGKVLLAPTFTGICGSDLHLRQAMKDVEAATPEQNREQLPIIVPGHEFSGTFVEAGPQSTTTFRPGDRLTAIPFTHGHLGEPFATIGLSPVHNGGLADYCLVDEDRVFSIPDEVSNELAALAEPLAVGLHAVNLAKRNLGPNIVIGCGPVGLSVILSLKAQGRGPILAADFSPERRAVAALLGADIVVDPSQDSPYEHWEDLQFNPSPASPLLAREFSGHPPGSNIFECVGVPGVIEQVINNVPQHSHVIIVGVCSHVDKVTPLAAIIREITLEFSFAYQPGEFAASLEMIKNNQNLVGNMITAKFALSDTAKAFDQLTDNIDQIKVLVEPGRR